MTHKALNTLQLIVYVIAQLVMIALKYYGITKFDWLYVLAPSLLFGIQPVLMIVVMWWVAFDATLKKFKYGNTDKWSR
jgi:hypothetical protein